MNGLKHIWSLIVKHKRALPFSIYATLTLALIIAYSISKDITLFLCAILSLDLAFWEISDVRLFEKMDALKVKNNELQGIINEQNEDLKRLELIPGSESEAKGKEASAEIAKPRRKRKTPRNKKHQETPTNQESM